MSKKQMLIVDDNDALRAALQAVFEDDYELEFAASGEEALMKYHRRTPQVVLMDYKMPGISGLETLQRLQGEAQKSPVVLMSAYDEKPVVNTALAHGASDFVGKPFNVNQIKAVIERAMDGRQEEVEPEFQPLQIRKTKAYQQIQPVMTQSEVDELVEKAMRLTCV
jgi:DNA-binding NtrC family response regulator